MTLAGDKVRFEFATSTRIVFGPGVFREIASDIRLLGKTAVIVHGKSRERAQALAGLLEMPVVECEIAGEPRIDQIRAVMRDLHNVREPVVIGLGGGGVLDGARAVAGLLTNPGDILDYLEIIGKGKTIAHRAAPLVAIPTTSGTGSEVTRNAVLTSPEHSLKVSLRSPLLLPLIACVDPELTLTVPPALTANTGMDALSHILESFVSHAANPMTDAICREGLMRARSLLPAFKNGNDLAARSDMSLASLMGGMALANSRLGAVHGFAAPLGGTFDAPHGAVCAALLAPVMEVNIRALCGRDPGSPSLERYAVVAQILTNDQSVTAEDGVKWVSDLAHHLGISGISSFGVTDSHFSELCVKAAAASSMKGNPIVLQTEELQEILHRAR